MATKILAFKLTEGMRYTLAEHLAGWEDLPNREDSCFEFVIDEAGYAHIMADGLWLHRDGEWATYPEQPAALEPQPSILEVQI